MGCSLCQYMKEKDPDFPESLQFENCYGDTDFGHDVCTEVRLAHGERCHICQDEKIEGNNLFCRRDFAKHATSHVPLSDKNNKQRCIQIRNKSFPRLSSVGPFDFQKALSEIRSGNRSASVRASLNLGLLTMSNILDIDAMKSSGKLLLNSKYEINELNDNILKNKYELDLLMQKTMEHLTTIPYDLRAENIGLISILNPFRKELFLGILDRGTKSFYPTVQITKEQGGILQNFCSDPNEVPDLLTNTFLATEEDWSPSPKPLENLFSKDSLSAFVHSRRQLGKMLSIIKPLGVECDLQVSNSRIKSALDGTMQLITDYSVRHSTKDIHTSEKIWGNYMSNLSTKFWK